MVWGWCQFEFLGVVHSLKLVNPLSLTHNKIFLERLFLRPEFITWCLIKESHKIPSTLIVLTLPAATLWIIVNDWEILESGFVAENQRKCVYEFDGLIWIYSFSSILPPAAWQEFWMIHQCHLCSSNIMAGDLNLVTIFFEIIQRNHIGNGIPQLRCCSLQFVH